MSFVERIHPPVFASPDTRDPVCERVLSAAGSHRAVVLQVRAEELARHVRRAATCSADVGAPGHAVVQWLQANLGQDEDRLRRAAIAALALGLPRRVGGLPPAVLAAYPPALERLTRRLQAKRAYAFDAFSRDAGLTSGLSAPIGSFNVVVPEPNCPEALLLRTRRAATSVLRHAQQFGGRDGRAFMGAAGVRPWAELHLDLRVLDTFSAEGFVASYHVIADLLRSRPDLAGLYAGSWLYDPRLSAISPELAFVRRTAEDGGARIVRLRADPAQTGYAIARSPKRRELVESGQYRPVCYGMYWLSCDLLAWSEHTRTD